MGKFKVVVEATGGHGCQRNLGDGDTVLDCADRNCPDCITREYIRRLKRAGCFLEVGLFFHWPGTDSEVKDDLISGKRTGNF